MANYFNTLNLRQQLAQLGKCRFMKREEFATGCEFLKGKKVVIVGCGAQGLNQGLNMRDSGLDVSYALRAEAIAVITSYSIHYTKLYERVLTSVVKRETTQTAG